MGLPLKALGRIPEFEGELLWPELHHDSGNVVVLDGPNANRATVTGPDGAYQLYDLQPGSFTVRFSRAGYTTKDAAYTLTGRTFNNLSLELVKLPYWWIRKQVGATSGFPFLSLFHRSGANCFAFGLLDQRGGMLLGQPVASRAQHMFARSGPNRSMSCGVAVASEPVAPTGWAEVADRTLVLVGLDGRPRVVPAQTAVAG